MTEKRQIDEIPCSAKQRTPMPFSKYEKYSVCAKPPTSGPLDCHEKQHNNHTALAEFLRNHRFSFHGEGQYMRINYFDDVDKIIENRPFNIVSSSGALKIVELEIRDQLMCSSTPPSNYFPSISSFDLCYLKEDTSIHSRMQLFRERLKDKSLPLGEKMKYIKCLERFDRRLSNRKL